MGRLFCLFVPCIHPPFMLLLVMLVMLVRGRRGRRDGTGRDANPPASLSQNIFCQSSGGFYTLFFCPSTFFVNPVGAQVFRVENMRVFRGENMRVFRVENMRVFFLNTLMFFS